MFTILNPLTYLQGVLQRWRIAYEKKLFAAGVLLPNKRYLVIDEDNSIVLQHIQNSLWWFGGLLWLRSRPAETTRLTLAQLAKSVYTAANLQAVEATTAQLKQRCLNAASIDMIPRKNSLAKKLRKVFADNLEQTARTMKKNKANRLAAAEEAGVKLATAALTRFKQESLAMAKEKLHAEKFKPTINQLVNDMVQQHPMLFAPEQTFATDDILPVGVIHFRQTLTGRCLVIEQPPQIRSIKFEDSFLAEKSKAFAAMIRKNDSRVALAFPYTVFLIKTTAVGEFQELRCFFRNRPVISLNDELYYSALPNQCLSNSRAYCLGNTISRQEFTALPTLAEKAKYLLDRFWLNTYTTAGLDKFQRATAANPKMRSLEVWADNTAVDASFILQCTWETAGSLQAELANILEEKPGEATIKAVFRQEITKLFKGAEKDIEKIIRQALEAVPTEGTYDEQLKKQLTEKFNQVIDTMLTAAENQTISKADAKAVLEDELGGIFQEVLNKAIATTFDANSVEVAAAVAHQGNLSLVKTIATLSTNKEGV